MQEQLLGRWFSDEKGDPHLRFNSDGTVKGSDGCNGILTSYEVHDDSATLATFVTTAQKCLGVDDWLHDVAEVRIEEDQLIVLDSNGGQIGTLQRDADDSAD